MPNDSDDRFNREYQHGLESVEEAKEQRLELSLDVWANFALVVSRIAQSAPHTVDAY